MDPGTAIPFLTIPPELFPLIASYIPLRSAPHTLRSLGLVNRRFHDLFCLILYSRVLLRCEDDAIGVIQKVLDRPQLGRAVTELHVMSDLSIETGKGRKPFDIVAGIHMLIKKQLIPRLVSLGIYLTDGWIYDENYQLILHGRLLTDFWSDLREECPRLCSLSLRNVGHSSEDPWQSGPVIDAMNSISGLSTLRVEWTGDSEGLSKNDSLKFLNALPRLTSSLHTLNLESPYQDAEVILSLNFPNLKWLRLNKFGSGNKTAIVMGFFLRHPQIESLSLLGCMGNWFSDNIEEEFLPNLRHLKARFEDIRLLVPILPQLLSLGFVESYNAQVPYLLRAVLPNGLPRLKSLEIEQDIADPQDRKLEGVLWYESLDDHFRIEKNRKKAGSLDFENGYMHSIVRGAPNLEELGLHGMFLSSDALETLGSTLSQLVKMERFYYRGFSPKPTHGNGPPPEVHEEMLSDFLSSAEALARACTRLSLVTSISAKYLPYISAKIERDSAGDVTGVRRSDGVGMLISADENDPFPFNP